MKITAAFFILTLFITVAMPGTGYSENNASETELETLAKQLAELENQIQVLYDQVENKTESLRNEDRLFLTRKAEIESYIQRKNLKLKQINQELAKQTDLLKAKSEEHRDVVPVVTHGIRGLQAYINSALPFKQKERLAQLTDLETKINPDNPVLLPERALNTLWAYYEDEIRMCREYGIYKQTIQLDRGNILADLVKIGMVGMFYMTPDKEAGVIMRDGDSYALKPLKEDKAVEHVTTLMDDFRKQIRTGYFVLPNFLSRAKGDR